MAINYKTRNNPKKSSDKQEIGFRIIFFALNFLLVPFSVIATYNGYVGFLDEKYQTMILATATGLMFFGLNYIIMERRRKGISHLIQSIGFLLPLSISFFGNFTYFYGNQMEGTLLDKDLTYYSTTLDETFQNARSGLNNSTGLANLEARFNADLQLLRIEINQKEPYGGCGPACERKWEEIKQVFNDYNQKYNGSSGLNLNPAHDKTYASFETIATTAFNAIKSTKENEINTKLAQLSSQYDPVNKVADSLLSGGNEKALKSHGVDIIKKIRKANNNIGEKAEGFLPKYTYQKLGEYQAVNAKDIKSVLDSAFVKKDNNSAMVFSLVLSLVIDLATLGFVFLALSYNKQRKNKNPGPIGL